MEKIIVLGAGNMGAHIASLLSVDYAVTIADYSQVSLDKITSDITKVRADLSQPSVVKELASAEDLVITALPEAFGYQALEAVIESGKPAVDISFWTQTEERIAHLNDLAKKEGVTVFIDSGVAPGFSNALVAYFDLLLAGKTKTANVYVGGIPLHRERGFFAPWSVAGLIEEYTRQALHVRNGRQEKSPALSLIETLDSLVGPLDAGLTDGLRTLPFNLPHIQTMGEYTLRYPGHFQQMLALKELGFFDDTIDSANNLTPRKLAAAILSKKWKMQPADRDILVMRIQADDGVTQHTANIYAKHNGKSSAMALTTGGMAALSAKMLASGLFQENGVFPLELVIKKEPKLMEYYVAGMKAFGVDYSQRTVRL